MSNPYSVQVSEKIASYDDNHIGLHQLSSTITSEGKTFTGGDIHDKELSAGVAKVEVMSKGGSIHCWHSYFVLTPFFCHRIIS